MKWTEAYRTGVPALDAQHKMLFQMSEDFQAVIAEGAGEGSYGEFLRSLRLFVRAHFGAEENCMLRLHCRAYEHNSRAHEGFSNSIAKLEARFERDGFSPVDAQAALEMVDRWLVDHIGRIDVQLLPLVEAGTS